MEYKLNKYDKAQMYLLYYMLKNNFVIFMYDSEKVYMPNLKYRKLASSISNWHRLLVEEEIPNISFSKYCEKDEELLQTLKEIQSLRLLDTFTIAEIDDYIRVIKEYNLKTELANLVEKVKNECVEWKKFELAQEVIKKRKEIEEFNEKFTRNLS